MQALRLMLGAVGQRQITSGRHTRYVRPMGHVGNEHLMNFLAGRVAHRCRWSLLHILRLFCGLHLRRRGYAGSDIFVLLEIVEIAIGIVVVL